MIEALIHVVLPVVRAGFRNTAGDCLRFLNFLFNVGMAVTSFTTDLKSKLFDVDWELNRLWILCTTAAVTRGAYATSAPKSGLDRSKAKQQTQSTVTHKDMCARASIHTCTNTLLTAPLHIKYRP